MGKPLEMCLATPLSILPVEASAPSGNVLAQETCIVNQTWKIIIRQTCQRRQGQPYNKFKGIKEEKIKRDCNTSNKMKFGGNAPGRIVGGLSLVQKELMFTYYAQVWLVNYT